MQLAALPSQQEVHGPNTNSSAGIPRYKGSTFPMRNHYKVINQVMFMKSVYVLSRCAGETLRSLDSVHEVINNALETVRSLCEGEELG
jgi:hypothetical protein